MGVGVLRLWFFGESLVSLFCESVDKWRCGVFVNLGFGGCSVSGGNLFG